jgi:predicted nucleic acid-binding protein
MSAVVDASVALKWFLDEPGAAQALAFRERHLRGDLLLVAPDLLLYEVGNALRFKHGFTPSGIQQALSDLLHFQLELIGPTERLLRHAVDLAHRTGLTYYDSFYLAAASDLGTQLITADTRLHAASGKLVAVTLLH